MTLNLTSGFIGWIDLFEQLGKDIVILSMCLHTHFYFGSSSCLKLKDKQTNCFWKMRDTDGNQWKLCICAYQYFHIFTLSLPEGFYPVRKVSICSKN